MKTLNRKDGNAITRSSSYHDSDNCDGIPCAQTGWRLRVVGLHVSAAGPTVVTIGFSATNQRVSNLASNQTVDVGEVDWQGDAAAALTMQSSAAAAVDVTAYAVPELAN